MFKADGAMADLLSDMHDAQSKESAILLQIAAIALIKKGTPIPLRFNYTLPEPCAPETRQLAPVAAVSMLNQLLDDISANGLKLIERWLSLCAHHGRLIPDYLLPVVLEKLRNKKPPITLINLCGGNHLNFLIMANEDWKVFDMTAQKSETTLLAKLDNGTKEERLASFLQMRHRQPDKAVALIETNFAKEPVDMRVSFVKRMEPAQLSDLAFLEQLAKNDKSKEVRELACEMLALLPGATVIELLHRHLDEIIKISGQKLEIIFEDEVAFEKRMAALDDVAPNFTVSNQALAVGKKGSYLRKLVGRINPDYLLECYKTSTHEITALFAQDELWHQALLDGLMEAVSFFGSRAKSNSAREWQTTIVKYMGEKLTESHSGLRFFQSLPADLLETILLEKLPKWAQEGTTVAPKLDFWYQLDKVQFDWSESFTQRIIDFIVKEAKEKVPALDYTFRTSVNNFALDMHISAVNRIDELANIRRDGEQTDFFAKPLNQLVDILCLRRDIEAAFTE